MTITHRKPLRVCFSFAAYAKNLLEYLKSFNIPVEEGLTDAEFSSVESNFNFKFPPDLRSILHEGLPTGPGFPNWRSSSNQQLDILINLPILGLCKEVSAQKFWLDTWGERPRDDDQAVNLAKRFLKKAPLLIPIHRHFYIPSAPCTSGNPVFYVRGGDIKLWGFDLTGFFQQVEFRKNEEGLKRPTFSKLLNTPAWAATEPRRIEFWTALAERKEKPAAADGEVGWWREELRGCLAEMLRILRSGGWKEDDIREMMMMDAVTGDGDQSCEEDDNKMKCDTTKKRRSLDMDGVMWHVRLLSKRLLRAGWSTEDVMEALGFPDDDQTTDSPTGDCFLTTTKWR